MNSVILETHVIQSNYSLLHKAVNVVLLAECFHSVLNSKQKLQFSVMSRIYFHDFWNIFVITGLNGYSKCSITQVGAILTTVLYVKNTVCGSVVEIMSEHCPVNHEILLYIYNPIDEGTLEL